MDGCSGNSLKCQLCVLVSTHHLVDGAIEGIVLGEDEQNNKGHVHMMRVSVLHVVKDLKDGHHLRRREGEQEEEAERVRRCCHRGDIH